jgi:hypothetical protein
MQSSMAVAQPSNYWSWAFNTPSALLAGSVVGGGAGPSAIFYNPALISQQNEPSVALSASIISLQFYSLENIAGKGISTYEFSFKIQPRFISFSIPLKNENRGVNLAVLSPVSEGLEYSIQHIDELDIIKRTAGLETYTGYLRYNRKYNETWIGGGYSEKVSKRFSFGLSSFLVAKILDFSSSQISQANQQGDSVLVNGISEPKYIAESSFKEDFNYRYLSLIFKAGAQYIFPGENLSIGVNFTMPDLPVFGRSNIQKSFSRSNIYDNSNNGFVSSESSSGNEKDLDGVRVKTPFAVALGIFYVTKSKKTTITVTAEHFNKIHSYDIINSSQELNWTPRYVSDAITGNNYMSYAYEARSITNAAIGIKQLLRNESIAFLTGFRTDLRATNTLNTRYTNKTFAIPKGHFNKYHFTTGVLFKYNNLKLSTGVQYSFGKIENARSIVNYSEPVEYIPESDYSLQGAPNSISNTRFDELSLIVSFSVDLNTKDNK